MRHLFSPAGEQALSQLARRRALLAFDFDGTLAPIVARPDDAQVCAVVGRRLADLAREHPVAVITGRSMADVRPRLGFEPAYVVGNHGAEGIRWSGSIDSLRALRLQLLSHADALLATGVQLEDKGLSLALHYRLAGDRAAALHLIEQLLRDLPDDLRSFGGKCVVNIVARAAPDKGDAVLALLQHSGCDALLFVGDDVNDETVFERAQPDWLTVRIGSQSEPSHAKFFLTGHAEMALLLEKLHVSPSRT